MDYQRLMQMLMAMMGGSGGSRFGGSSTGGRFGTSGRTIGPAKPAARLDLARDRGLRPNRFEVDREGFGDNLLAALNEMNERFTMEQGRTASLFAGLDQGWGVGGGAGGPIRDQGWGVGGGAGSPGGDRQASRPRRLGGRSGVAADLPVDYTAARRKAPGLFSDEGFGRR